MASSTTAIHRYGEGDRLIFEPVGTDPRPVVFFEPVEGEPDVYDIEVAREFFELEGLRVGESDLRAVDAEEYERVRKQDWDRLAENERREWAAKMAEYGISDDMPCPQGCENRERFGGCHWVADAQYRPIRTHGTDSVCVKGDDGSVDANLYCDERPEGFGPWLVAIDVAGAGGLTIEQTRQFMAELSSVLDRYTPTSG